MFPISGSNMLNKYEIKLLGKESLIRYNINQWSRLKLRYIPSIYITKIILNEYIDKL